MISVILTAAGKSTRFKSDVLKQFYILDDLPIIIRTILKFDYEEIGEIIICINKDNEKEFNDILSEYNHLNKKLFDKIILVHGSNKRYLSVYNAVNKVKNEFVIIHDGVRPFVSEKIIKEHINLLKTNDAIITGIRPNDSIKLTEGNKVSSIINRDNILLTQTPQSFNVKGLKECYNKIDINGELDYTDEDSILNSFGYKSIIVSGDIKNIKITSNEDLILAERFVKCE